MRSAPGPHQIRQADECDPAGGAALHLRLAARTAPDVGTRNGNRHVEIVGKAVSAAGSVIHRHDAGIDLAGRAVDRDSRSLGIEGAVNGEDAFVRIDLNGLAADDAGLVEGAGEGGDPRVDLPMLRVTADNEGIFAFQPVDASGLQQFSNAR